MQFFSPGQKNEKASSSLWLNIATILQVD